MDDLCAVMAVTVCGSGGGGGEVLEQSSPTVSGPGENMNGKLTAGLPEDNDDAVDNDEEERGRIEDGGVFVIGNFLTGGASGCCERI